ncbi:MAG: InlB B-repeat-containing protein [Paludibacteraceae bacterium]|nr:InlB B-repeat-containing protein [Paludibacteraceae bacterium]
MLVCSPTHAINIRFWDDGVLIHTAQEINNSGNHFLSSYDDGSVFVGHLAECDGYTFAGWKKDSPLMADALCSSDNDAGIIDRVIVADADIDVYAVYKKSTVCYNRISSYSNLENGANFLIVGKNGSNYYAMNYTQLNGTSQKGLNTTQVYPVADGASILIVDNACVWKQRSNISGVYFKNNANSRELVLNYSIFSGYSDLLTTSGSGSSLLFSPSDGVWTISKLLNNNHLYFAIENTFEGLSGYANIFTSDYNDRDVPKTKGDIYLYKQSDAYSIYRSKCDSYTLQLKACGDVTCKATSITPSSATETSTTYGGLTTYSGINTSSYTPTINCPVTWDFAGWATTPCPNLTIAEPSYAPNPFPLERQNEMLYAVYYQKDGGDYWSSYPACRPFTANFYPQTGTIVDHASDNPYVAIETPSAGDGFIIPAATTPCTPDEWTFAGWTNEPIVHTTTTASVVLPAAGTLFHPIADDLSYYALYYCSAIDRYTSYPLCSPANITLDAVYGTIDGNRTKVLTESERGIGVTLQNATSPCAGTWNFAGWSRVQIAPTTTAPTLFTSAETFYPIRPNEYLYAVYVRGNVRLQTWTSTPACEPFSAVFHACSETGCGAKVHGEEVNTQTELIMGGGITIPSDLSVTGYCPRWDFVGWRHGSPIEQTYTDPTSTLLTSGLYHPSQNNEAFYAVYKHADINYWTSNPDCSPYNVYLHACEGEFDPAVTVYPIDTMLAEAGAGITLPEVSPYCEERGWTFVGWVEGGQLNTTDNISGLTIRAAGTNFKPIHNNTHLYAVYSISGYKKVTSSAELIAGDEYVIAFFWDYGTAYSYTHFALSNQAHVSPYTDCLNLKPIQEYTDDNGNKFVINPGVSCRWKLDGNSTLGWTFQSKETDEYVSSFLANRSLGMNIVYTTYDINLDEAYVQRKTYSASYRYWHFKNVGVNSVPNPTFYAYQDDNPDRCYFYHATGTVYSSWPHCQEYTVKFDGCDGMATVASLEEVDAGKGITLPTVTDICAGWSFAGWAASPYDTLVSALNQNLYMPGAKYVPTKNNATLYAVYYKPKAGNTFTLVPNMSKLYTGGNYVIVEETTLNTKAMGNLTYIDGLIDNYGIKSEDISISSNKVSNPPTATIWQLQGYENNYFWYNPSVSKYLDLDTKIGAGILPYASLQETAKDNFTISYASGHFHIRSNINQYYLRKNILTGITFFQSSNYVGEIDLYAQDADYWSYPCSKPVEPMRWGEGSMIVESLSLEGAPERKSSRITSITGENGIYEISFDSEPSRKMRIKWGDNYYRMTIPFVASETNAPAVEYQPFQHLVILPNGSFTVEKQTNLKRLSIYENGELIIADGDTLFVDTLILRSYGDEQHPRINYGSNTSAIVVGSGVVYHDLRIDDVDYYPFSVPYDANVSDIIYSGLIPEVAKPTRGLDNVTLADYWIQYYDGVERAEENGAGDTYWKVLTDASVIGGKGYTIGFYNTLAAHPERTIRFKMTPAASWSGEQNGTFTRAITISPSLASDKVNSGWNFIGNPYLGIYSPGETDASNGLLTGEWEKDGSGNWIRKTETLAVPYFTFYSGELHDYYQVASNMARIKPFAAVFIQAEDADKTMLLYEQPIRTDEPTPAPLRTSEEKSPVVKTGLILAPSGVEYFEPDAPRLYDETGLVISDRYTKAYEVGADLAKMIAQTTVLHVYSLNGQTRLAFNALDVQSAAQPIPLGVCIPQTGSYTFRFDNRQYDPELLEALWLTDKQENQTVNLLKETYTCTIQKGLNEARFALNAALQTKPVSTDIEAVSIEGLRITTNADGSLSVNADNRLTAINVYDVAGRLLCEQQPNCSRWTVNLPQGVYVISVTNENNQTNHIKFCSK